MISIAEFCDRHDACADGREWALANCRDMQHAWETLRPKWLIWVATRPDVLTDRELRKFAVWSARQVQHLMTDSRSLAALDVADRHADGLATDEELKTAEDAACEVAYEAVWAAAWAAAWAAEQDAAEAAEQTAAEAVAEAARKAGAAAGASVARAVRNSARDAQAAWLRENTTPNFGGGK